MKKTPWIAIILLFAASAASAALPAPLEVTEDDLTSAGISNVTSVVPTPDRFLAPVRYFRTADTLSAKDAKKDCADCADLVAVYVADVSAVPKWVVEPQQQFMKIGARLQLRAYIASTKRVVIVTGPSEASVRKISKALVTKFSR
ncbi:MAG: hypothetical protein WC866_00975 [Patescibacteria group bacterium]|jgi:hypothetical protein